MPAEAAEAAAASVVVPQGEISKRRSLLTSPGPAGIYKARSPGGNFPGGASCQPAGRVRAIPSAASQTSPLGHPAAALADVAVALLFGRVETLLDVNSAVAVGATDAVVGDARVALVSKTPLVPQAARSAAQVAAAGAFIACASTCRRVIAHERVQMGITDLVR